MTATPEPSVIIEVLHVPDCPNLAPMLDRLHEVTDISPATREVRTTAEASALGMAGSPTVLINGVDPFAKGEVCERGIACRLYRDQNDQIVPAPSTEQLRDALARVTGTEQSDVPDRCCSTDEESSAVNLSTWRARAIPLDPLERAVHQAALRRFATTGLPPSIDDLRRETDASRHAVHDVLRRLHDSDAIRLDADAAIEVAYPFSARPTRHRVRIADHVEVYAMCGIDALGIQKMLDEDVRIETADPVTEDPITITCTDGRIVWNPQDGVAFVAASAGGGPSAESCCDYLNLFASRATAQEWIAAHPSIPGSVLTQSEAEDLANTLFGTLLSRKDAVRA